MSHIEKDDTAVINLYPVNRTDGETTFSPWPDLAVDWIIRAVSRLVTTRTGKLTLWGCGLTAILLIFSDDAHGKREQP
jgi:hypothetical protein